MLWVTATQDPNSMVLQDDDKTIGIVQYMPGTGRYMASTQRLYLGTYKTLQNAQKAVETKCKVEMKGSGRIIV